MSRAPLALYVHWPFCTAKCPYCDFNSHVREGVDQARWRRALLTELEHWAARLGERALVSVFFGGGTPSLMEPETVATVLARAVSLWPPVEDLEVTLEANPSSVEAGRFAAYREAGVNRISIGIQALDDAALRFLGRRHTVAEALAALALAMKTFPRVSFDLIYARPGQTAAAWEEELRRALGLGTRHLSLYQLTIEPGTRFYARARAGLLAPPDEDAQAELFERTQELTAAAGLPAYEISNHARPGEECRHNLVYWRYGEYVGIGPGAHGRIVRSGRRFATRALRQPEAWLAAVERRGHGLEAEEELSPREQLVEALMMGLRLAEGVPVARLERLAGAAWREALNVEALDRARAEGLLENREDRLVATAAGRERLDALLRAILR
ncbi:MAG: radical SAM family heme chaperone HemW [Geminicoccaceae bacterium]|nr:radical SAM family heme chaperone HemW [Geminicoccaceae bacterium]MDW8125345.1 radical SAM family heme chaperone HemW [Geminicoccaceae bacterium]